MEGRSGCSGFGASGGLMSNPLAEFDELLTEQEVCKRNPQLLSDRELREARRNNEIAFVTGKQGQISYRPSWVAEYLHRKITPCQRPLDASGNTETIGSAVSLAPTTSTSQKS